MSLKLTVCSTILIKFGLLQCVCLSVCLRYIYKSDILCLLLLDCLVASAI